jgi:hypothetical protein
MIRSRADLCQSVAAHTKRLYSIRWPAAFVS